MGVRPLDDGWRRIAIRPLPGSKLKQASMAVLTPRGVVGLSFDMATVDRWVMNVTLPGNTKAQVSRAGLGNQIQRCKLSFSRGSSSLSLLQCNGQLATLIPRVCILLLHHRSASHAISFQSFRWMCHVPSSTRQAFPLHVEVHCSAWLRTLVGASMPLRCSVPRVRLRR